MCLESNIMKMVSPSRAKVVQVTYQPLWNSLVSSLEFFIVRLSHYVYHIFLGTCPKCSRTSQQKKLEIKSPSSVTRRPHISWKFSCKCATLNLLLADHLKCQFLYIFLNQTVTDTDTLLQLAVSNIKYILKQVRREAK